MADNKGAEMSVHVRRLVLAFVWVLTPLVFAPAMAMAQQVPDEQVTPAPAGNAIHFNWAGQPLFTVAPLSDIATAEPSQTTGSSPRHEGIGFGIKGGVNRSSLTGQGGETNRTGWQAGVFFGGNRPGTVGVMAEILYAKKGSGTGSGSTPVDLYYLEIPVLARINVGSSSLSGVSFYILAGPEFDIQLKGKFGSTDVSKSYKGLDIVGTGGVGVEITRLFIEVRGSWGFKSILSATGAANSTLHSRSVAALLGLRFN
jgi:hypothetical protein